jgi:biopolymer transport protein ExbD
MPSDSIKRQRRRKRIDDDGDPEFQVAPMIDVLLVLTLFFMSITSTELLKKDRNLQLADARDAKKPHKLPGEIVINVSWNHNNNTAGFSIDGMAYPDANSLQGYVAQQVAKDSRSYALIRADKDVQYSNISDVMAACAAAGISSVNFGVIISANTMRHEPAPSQ